MCLGIPGKVVETFTKDDLPMGKVDFGGIAKEICLAYTPEATPGDYVIVHVGFAISRVDETEAQEIFSYLKQIEEAGEVDTTETKQSTLTPSPSPASGRGE